MDTKRKSSIPTQYIPGAAKCRPLVGLNTKEKIHFVASFDYIMANSDGVIWKFYKAIPNVGPAIMLLKKHGKKFKLVTNDSQHTDNEFEILLHEAGITDIKHDDLIYPAKTIVRYLNKYNKQNSPLFSICNQKSNDYFERMNLNIITLERILEANKNNETTTSLNFANIQKILTPKEKVVNVIVDSNYNLTYAHIAAAQQYLFNSHCSLLVGASKLDNHVATGFTTLGNSGIVNMLQESRTTDAILLGTQGRVLGEEIMEQFHIVDPKRVLFVGNSALNDIQFGIRSGFQTLFVFSGMGKQSDTVDLTQDTKPDYIGDSLGDFVKFFEELH